MLKQISQIKTLKLNSEVRKWPYAVMQSVVSTPCGIMHCFRPFVMCSSVFQFAANKHRIGRLFSSSAYNSTYNILQGNITMLYTFLTCCLRSHQRQAFHRCFGLVSPVKMMPPREDTGPTSHSDLDRRAHPSFYGFLHPRSQRVMKFDSSQGEGWILAARMITARIGRTTTPKPEK